VYVAALVPFDITSVKCRPLYLTFGFIVTAGYIVAEFILFMRAYAVWGGKRSVFLMLAIVLSLGTASGLYFSNRFLGSINVMVIPVFPNGCIVSFGSQIQWAAFLTLICTETFALGVLLVKSLRYPSSTLMRTIHRDGIMYYVFILTCSIVNVVVLKVASPALCNMMIDAQGALHSIFCNRLLLHIRDTYNKSIDVVTLSGDLVSTPLSMEMSQINFKTPRSRDQSAA